MFVRVLWLPEMLTVEKQVTARGTLATISATFLYILNYCKVKKV